MDPVRLLDRYQGSMLGLACGDAVGTTLEFRAPGTFQAIKDMQGGGPFELEPGQWTDDTSMALCLAESLLFRQGFDPRDQMNRYTNWWKWGYLSSTGECFDIGNTVLGALKRYLETGDPLAGSTDPMTAGNGSLMRLAPVALYYYPDPVRIDTFCAESSKTTHGAEEAVDACRLMGHLLKQVLDGRSKSEVFEYPAPVFSSARILALSRGDFLSTPEACLVGSGYAVASLEAALWQFFHRDSYADIVLSAANLGDDADTTAAIAGQLAGAYYGASAIPDSWLERLHMRDEITRCAERLYEEGVRSIDG